MTVCRGWIVSAESFEPFLSLLGSQSDAVSWVALDNFLSKACGMNSSEESIVLWIFTMGS